MIRSQVPAAAAPPRPADDPTPPHQVSPLFHDDVLTASVAELKRGDLFSFGCTSRGARRIEKSLWRQAAYRTVRAAVGHLELSEVELSNLTLANAALSHHRSLVDCALQSNAQVPMPPLETAWTKLVEYIRTGQPEHRAACIGALARLVPFATRSHKQEAWFQAHDWPDLVACALGSEWDSQVEDNIGVRLACLGAMKCLLEDPTVPVPPTWERKIYVAGFDQDEHVRLAAVALWKPLVLRKEEPCLRDFLSLYDRSTMNETPRIVAQAEADFASIIDELNPGQLASVRRELVPTLHGESTARVSDLLLGVLAHYAARAGVNELERIFTTATSESALAHLSRSGLASQNFQAAVTALTRGPYTQATLAATVRRLIEALSDSSLHAAALAYLVAWAPRVQGVEAVELFDRLMDVYEQRGEASALPALAALVSKVDDARAARAWEALWRNRQPHEPLGFLRFFLQLESIRNSLRQPDRTGRRQILAVKAKLETVLADIVREPTRDPEFSDNIAALRAFFGPELVAAHVRKHARRLMLALQRHALWFHPEDCAAWAAHFCHDQDLTLLAHACLERAEAAFPTAVRDRTPWREGAVLDHLSPLDSLDTAAAIWPLAEKAATVQVPAHDDEASINEREAAATQARIAAVGLKSIETLSARLDTAAFATRYALAPAACQLAMLAGASDAAFNAHIAEAEIDSFVSQLDGNPCPSLRTLCERVLLRAASELPLSYVPNLFASSLPDYR